MFKKLILVVVAAFAVRAEAVSHVAAERWTADEPDVLNLKFGFMTPSFRLSTESRVESAAGSEVEFSPPSASKNFIGMGYRNLGATIQWGGRQSEDSNRQYGDGSSFDVQATLYGQRLTQQYFYQNYSGYYVENTSTVDPAFPVNAFI